MLNDAKGLEVGEFLFPADVDNPRLSASDDGDFTPLPPSCALVAAAVVSLAVVPQPPYAPPAATAIPPPPPLLCSPLLMLNGRVGSLRSNSLPVGDADLDLDFALALLSFLSFTAVASASKLSLKLVGPFLAPSGSSDPLESFDRDRSARNMGTTGDPDFILVALLPPTSSGSEPDWSVVVIFPRDSLSFGSWVCTFSSSLLSLCIFFRDNLRS